MNFPQYFARTANDGSPMYLIRVGQNATADIYNVASGTWVPAPNREATLELCEPGSSDVDAIRPEDLAGAIARLEAGT